MILSLDQQDERNRRWDTAFGDEPLDGETVGRILALPAFADVRADSFPAHLNLDALIANEGRIRTYKRGEVILRHGDYGNSLFIILAGSVVGINDPALSGKATGRRANGSASWRRSLAQLFSSSRPPEYRRARNFGTNGPNRRSREAAGNDSGLEGVSAVDIDELLARHTTFSFEAPQMFGELAALTRSPRSASIFAAEDDTILFELSWQGLRDVRDWSESFRQQIDRLYHERGLVIRLRECPVFDHVDDETLDKIAEEALFETYGNFNWTHRFKREMDKSHKAETIIGLETLICEQGDHVDGLLLINNGFARISKQVDHGERTIGHLSKNDFFGLDDIFAANKGAGATLRTSLRAIGYVDVIRIPTYLVHEHVLPGLDAGLLTLSDVDGGSIEHGELQQGMMDFLVDHRFINGEQAMVINQDRCVGCDDCVRACAVAHDNNPRFVRAGPAYENALVANACMHCTDPVCLIGCPTGAIHRSSDTGTVLINDDTCIGCATCANSCPYNNIQMVEIRDKNGDFLLDRDGKTIARATKCDLCSDQLTGPACVQACPHDALMRTNIRDTDKLVKWLR
ncbi:MAG: cyclic nucleotide-binding domain-containing protein [Roseibium sp.]